MLSTRVLVWGILRALAEIFPNFGDEVAVNPASRANCRWQRHCSSDVRCRNLARTDRRLRDRCERANGGVPGLTDSSLQASLLRIEGEAMKSDTIRRVPWTCEWGRFGVAVEELRWPVASRRRVLDMSS